MKGWARTLRGHSEHDVLIHKGSDEDKQVYTIMQMLLDENWSVGIELEFETEEERDEAFEEYDMLKAHACIKGIENMLK